ncbi:MAG: ATP synthase F1 subunit delta [Anaerovoracaceae bacterium]
MIDLPVNYARVLFDMNLDPGQVEEMRALLTESAELEDALCNPLFRKAEKRRVIDRLFPESTRSFVKVMCDNDDIGCSGEMFDAYDAMVRERDETVKAVFTYVTEPDEAQVERLKKKIAKDYNKKNVELELVHDPSLIGGFVLTVEDSVLDQSVKTSMTRLKRHFTER